MSKYRVTFFGRKNGAIGISYVCTGVVEALDPEGARLAVYETHEPYLRVEKIEPVSDDTLIEPIHGEGSERWSLNISRCVRFGCMDRSRCAIARGSRCSWSSIS